MSWRELLANLNQLLQLELMEVGGTHVTLKTILLALFIIFVALLLSRGIRRMVTSIFLGRGMSEDGNVLAINRLIHYGILLLGVGVALETAGFNLNALFAAGAVFAIGIGFAMQNLVQNFVAGVILLVERAIKPGDVLEVENRVVKVVKMAIRTTVVRSRDGDHWIVPNSVLVQSIVKNYTLHQSVYRIRVKVGVVYHADMHLVQEILEKVTRDIQWRLPNHDPIVLLTEFGDNSVNYDASVWVSDPWEGAKHRSKLHQAIWWAFKEKGIVIAFPQLDVHFDAPVEQGFSRLAAVR